jgi:hypothetical protein
MNIEGNAALQYLTSSNNTTEEGLSSAPADGCDTPRFATVDNVVTVSPDVAGVVGVARRPLQARLLLYEGTYIHRLYSCHTAS